MIYIATWMDPRELCQVKRSNLKMLYVIWSCYDLNVCVPSKFICWGLPWYGGWESICQCKGHGFDPWSKKMCSFICGGRTKARVPQLLEPAHPRAYALQQEMPPFWEALTPQERVAPTSETMKTHHSHQSVNKWASLVAQRCRSTCQCRRCQFDPWIRKIPWRGSGSPLQYFCLGNPMDRGAWRATVHGVEKSRTWLCA